MSTQELVDAFGNANVAGRVGKYFVELRHFGLIEATENGQYRATDLAADFIAGRKPVPAWVWPLNEKLPPECVPGPDRFLDEMTDDHPKEDRGRHVEDAVNMAGC